MHFKFKKVSDEWFFFVFHSTKINFLRCSYKLLRADAHLGMCFHEIVHFFSLHIIKWVVCSMCKRDSLIAILTQKLTIRSRNQLNWRSEHFHLWRVVALELKKEKKTWNHLLYNQYGAYVIAQFFQGGIGPKWKFGRTQMKNWSENFLHAGGAQKKGFPNFSPAAGFFVVETLKKR